MNDPKAIAKKKEFPRMLEQFKAEIARRLIDRAIATDDVVGD